MYEVMFTKCDETAMGRISETLNSLWNFGDVLNVWKGGKTLHVTVVAWMEALK
jgi:hypothetical protein